MSAFFNTKFTVVNRIAILGTVLMFYMAWRSEGFYNYDEHYQLLEYANYKAGLTGKDGLAWEFHQQIRPGLQPLIAYACMSGFRALGISNPFHLAFLLRLISGLLSIVLIFQIYRYLQKTYPTKKVPNSFLILSLFLWFAPFLNVRFSSENWAALFFFSGFLLLIQGNDSTGGRKLLNLALSGLLVSLAFQFRYQMTFSILGLFIWLLIYKKLDLFDWLLFSGGSLAGLGIGFLADKWLYGTWQFTPYLYFQSNIIEGQAAHFGVSPWWFYFTESFQILGIGINLTLFGLLWVGLYRARRHPFTWIFIPFILGHILVDHKELRFMFPMMIPFIFLVSQGWVAVPDRVSRDITVKLLGISLVAINFLLLAYRLKEPAYLYMPFYSFLYRQATPGQDLFVFYYQADTNAYNNNIYGPPHLQMTFYRPVQLKLIAIHHPDELDQYDISTTKSFVINAYPPLPPSRTKNQDLAFKYLAWQISDIKNLQFFKNTEVPRKIYKLQSK